MYRVPLRARPSTLGAELPGLSSRFEVVCAMFSGACETYRVKIRTSLLQLGMDSSPHVMEECKLPTLSYAHCRPNFVEVGSPRARGSSPYVIHCHPNFIEIGSPRAVGLSPHVAEMCKSTTYDLQCDVLLPVLLLAVTK